MSAPEQTTPVRGAQPGDADDGRGVHFREVLGERGTWYWIAFGEILTGGFIYLEFESWAVVAIAVALALPFGIWCAWKAADRRAADDFFHAYAKQRRLALGGRTALPEATPLLRKGSDRFAERTLTGELAPGIRGLLAMFSVVTERPSTRGSEKVYHPYTIGLVEVPESKRYVRHLYCQARSGLRPLDGFEDAFRDLEQRVELESEELDRMYEIFSDASQDPNWLRQLFTPGFIVWLTEEAPVGFAFQLGEGTMVAYLHGYQEDAADLDRLAVATATVATRLREESTETAARVSR